MRKDVPLSVQLPPPDRDNPGWVKVGVIAAVGFVIGIAWPRIMGVKLGPSAPGEAAAAAASASARAAAAIAPPASAQNAPNAKGEAKPDAGPPAMLATPSASKTGSANAGGAPQVTVARGAILSCKTTDGEMKKGRECGAFALDNVVAPHLRKLASCSAAEGQTGKLSFVATAEYPSGRLHWDIGKSSTVGNLDGITGCLKTHFSGVAATGVAHEHARYVVAYATTFAPGAPSSPTAQAPSAPEPASNAAPEPEKSAAGAGEASVGWEVALIRDVPKTGNVVARLPRGTKVKVGPFKDGWYAIKYGDNLASDGFVYRAAIGR